jgi:hypothetical protein
MVVAVSVVDRTGEVVERRLVALGLRAVRRSTDHSDRLASAVVELACALVHRRIVRLRRAIDGPVARRLAAEQALALYLYTLARPHEAQMGLFSQRAAADFEAARKRAALSTAAVARRLDLDRARSTIEIAGAAVVWIAERR